MSTSSNPDATLAYLRYLAARPTIDETGYGNLLAAFRELDDHLTAGGRPPEAWREGPDAPGADNEPYFLHYISADAPGDSAPWSVYREQYISAEHDEPIDGSQEHVSTHATETEADAEARRLQYLTAGGRPPEAWREGPDAPGAVPMTDDDRRAALAYADADLYMREREWTEATSHPSYWSNTEA